MNIGEIKDVVRDNVGNRDIAPHMLTYFLDMGRRELEKRFNFWFMRRTKDVTLIVDQQEYSITTAASGGFDIPDFKDVRTIWTRDPDPTFQRQFTFPPVKLVDFDEALSIFAIDDTGEPEQAVVDNNSLFVFPPNPDRAYITRFFHWVWTNNPTSDSGSDDLTTRFPEALIYAATMAGVRLTTKNEELARPWQQLMEAELRRIEQYEKDRGHQNEPWVMPARQGPFIRRSRRRIDNRDIFWFR